MEQEIKEKLTPRVLKKYVPETLTATQRKKQIKSILEGTKRPDLGLPRRKSKWTIMAHKYFGKVPTLEDISKETKVPIKGLKEILSKGEGAYYSSGSRIQQTPESWSYARLYAVLFGSPGARRVDKHIIDKYNIPILKLTGSGGKIESDITIQKEFPENYDPEIVDIIKDLSMTNGKEIFISGSMSFRSMLYASDYDLYEIVDYSKIGTIVKKFQDVIKKLLKRKNTFIGDIKCGSVEEWKVVDETAYITEDRVVGYDMEDSKKKMEELLDKKIITEEEYREGIKLLVSKPNAEQLQQIIKLLRFNILRWKPADILKGELKLRNGKMYPLEKALQDPALCKVDAIVLLDSGIFQEFSCIYEIRIGGRRKNLIQVNTVKSLLQDIEFYSSIGNWFKVAKRLFSLANYRFMTYSTNKKQNVEIMEKLYEILNSDLGIIYNVIEDINALLFLIENERILPIKRMKDEIEGFIERLSNVYSLNSYLNKEPKILRDIHLIVSGRDSVGKIAGRLEEILEILSNILSKETKKRLEETGLI
jgi:hypothetical protein